MSRGEHWNRIFAKKQPEEVSWYQSRLTRSLDLIERTGLPGSAGILDVGAGLSSLAGDLLERGYDDVSVLDCSAVAIDAARSALGDRAARVHWIEGDITALSLPASRFDLWHDRAVFHFLTEARDRAAYRASLERSLRSGGHLILATFASTGPERCSGLEVMRYDAESLQRELGERFRLLMAEEETHRTPSGKRQDFLYCHFRLDAA